MLIDDRFLLQALLKNITVTFVPIKTNQRNNPIKNIYRIHKWGEQHIYTDLNKRKLYGVVDVIGATRALIKNISDKDLKNGGFKTREDFEKWCIAKFKLTKDDYIGVVEFELLKLKPAGRLLLKHIISGDE